MGLRNRISRIVVVAAVAGMVGGMALPAAVGAQEPPRARTVATTAATFITTQIMTKAAIIKWSAADLRTRLTTP